MYFYKISVILKTDSVDRNKVKEDLDWYLAALYKNGNAIRGREILTRDNGFEVYIVIVENFPPKEGIDSNKYIEEFYQELSANCNISWENLGYLEEYGEVCACDRPTKYLMYTDQYSDDSLIICGDCGGCVPLYRLPYLEPYEGEHLALLGWQIAYQAMDHIWMESLVDRFSVYQMHNPKSKLSMRGRELCAELEEKTGIPTYYFLFNSVKRHKVCPLCGKSWREEDDGVADYFCDECRLATDR